MPFLSLLQITSSRESISKSGQNLTCKSQMCLNNSRRSERGKSWIPTTSKKIDSCGKLGDALQVFSSLNCKERFLLLNTLSGILQSWIREPQSMSSTKSPALLTLRQVLTAIFFGQELKRSRFKDMEMSTLRLMVLLENNFSEYTTRHFAWTLHATSCHIESSNAEDFGGIIAPATTAYGVPIIPFLLSSKTVMTSSFLKTFLKISRRPPSSPDEIASIATLSGDRAVHSPKSGTFDSATQAHKFWST